MKIQYKQIEQTLIDLYKSLPADLLSFPLDMIKIIKFFDDCKLWSYQYYAKHHGILVEDVINLCESHSGCTVYKPQTQQYLILFNKSVDNYNVEGRQSFTLAHELGHVKRKHLLQIKDNMVAENDFGRKMTHNPIYEKEANSLRQHFYLLCPYLNSLMYNLRLTFKIHLVCLLRQADIDSKIICNGKSIPLKVITKII